MQLVDSNIVGNLYGLRAGLSVISVECDQISYVEKDYEKNRNRIEDDLGAHSDIIEGRNQMSSFALRDLRYAASLCTRYIIIFLVSLAVCVICALAFTPVKNRNINTFDGTATYLCGSVLGVALIIICLVIQYVCCVEFMVDSFYGEILDKIEDNGFLKILIPVVGGICVVATVILFWAAADSDIYGTMYCGLLFGGILVGAFIGLITSIAFCAKFIEVFRCKILSNRHKRAAYTMEKLAKQNEPAYNASMLKLKNWRMQNIALHMKNINNMYVILKRLFQPILDERDWKHLDLIIYQIETRRADSIKEALQLVDRELQTQRIENMINSAKNAIVDTLNRGFSMLAQSLRIVYNGLSEQMRIMSSQMSAVSMQLCDMQVMNRALINKANMTSEALVRDMHQIRKNSDYMRFGIAV